MNLYAKEQRQIVALKEMADANIKRRKEKDMLVNSLEVQIRQQPHMVIIDLQGEVNAFAENLLNAAFAEAEERDANVILLNFSDVDYINSTGIALIVSLLTRACKSQRRLLTCGLNEHYIEIFSITHLVDLMSIFPDVETALASI